MHLKAEMLNSSTVLKKKLDQNLSENDIESILSTENEYKDEITRINIFSSENQRSLRNENDIFKINERKFIKYIEDLKKIVETKEDLIKMQVRNEFKLKEKISSLKISYKNEIADLQKSKENLEKELEIQKNIKLKNEKLIKEIESNAVKQLNEFFDQQLSLKNLEKRNEESRKEKLCYNCSHDISTHACKKCGIKQFCEECPKLLKFCPFCKITPFKTFKIFE